MIRKSARPWLLIAATLSLWSTFRPSPAPAQTVSFARSDIAAGFDHPIAVAVGDFNADGLQDLAVANHDSNTVSVLLGVGNGDFQEAPQSPIAVGTTPVWIAVGDFNGDGKPDLAVANVNSDTVSVLLGNGDGKIGRASCREGGYMSGHTRSKRDWSSDVCSSDLMTATPSRCSSASVMGTSRRHHSHPSLWARLPCGSPWATSMATASQTWP